MRLIDDLFGEREESISIALSNPVDAELGQGRYTLTISDNDALPAPGVGFFNAVSSGLASVAAPEILVILGGGQTVPVSVNYAVTGGTASAGSDYGLGAGVLTFAPGETAKRLPLSVVNDALSDSGETVQFTLSAPDGADDCRADGERALAVTASNGTDYVAAGQTAVIPAGQSSATMAVTPYDDRLNEGSQSVVMSVLPGAGYVSESSRAATVWIADHATQAPVSIPIGDFNVNTPVASYMIPFSVSDDETLPEDIRFLALSSNTAFVPQDPVNLRVQRTGGGVTLEVTPLAG